MGAGDVAERQEFTGYGVVTVLNADWTDGEGSDFGWVSGHQGTRLEPRTGYLHHRNRDYIATLQRWAQMDPNPAENGGMYVDGMNAYGFVRGNAVGGVDPSGLAGNPVADPLGYMYSVCRGMWEYVFPKGQPLRPVNVLMDILAASVFEDGANTRNYVAPPDDKATANNILYEFFNNVGPPERRFTEGSYMVAIMKDAYNLVNWRSRAILQARQGNFTTVKVSQVNSLGPGLLGWPSYASDITRMLVNKLSDGAYGNMGYVGSYSGTIEIRSQGGTMVTLRFRLKNVTSWQSGHVLPHHVSKTQYWEWDELHNVAPPPSFSGWVDYVPY
jgi:RHS repeat-associated protein